MPEVQAGAVMVDMTWPNSLSSFRLSTLSLAAFLSFSWSPVLPTGSRGPVRLTSLYTTVTFCG